MQAIYGGIEAADGFVFVLTPDSVASIPCGREIAHAAANNKRMIPIVAREVKADSVPEPLAKLNWIFFQEGYDFENATDTLLQALDKHGRGATPESAHPNRDADLSTPDSAYNRENVRPE